MKYITIMNFFSKGIFTVLVFFVITEESDFLYQPILIATGMLVSGIWALIYAIKHFNIYFIPPTQKEITGTIKNGFNIFFSIFVPNLYTNFSIILLGASSGSIATGLYSAANKFFDLCNQFAQVLSRTFFPFLARKIEKHAIYVKINGAISIIMSIALFLSADLLIRIFYTPDFEKSALIIRILSLSPFFMFLTDTYGTNFLILKGKDKIYRNIITFSSISGFALACFAVTKWSYIGVALTMVSVRALMGVLTWYYAQKYK